MRCSFAFACVHDEDLGTQYDMSLCMHAHARTHSHTPSFI